MKPELEADNSQRPTGVAVQRVVRRRLTAKDWDDAADLFEQGAWQAGEADSSTHSVEARKYAIKRMNSLAMYAAGKAMMERNRMDAESPNAKLTPLPLAVGVERKENNE